MKIFFIILVLCISLGAASQTGEAKKAKDFYDEYSRSKKLSDLDNAFLMISEAMKLEKNKINAIANFYNGLITKYYYDAKNLSNKTDLVVSAYNSISKALELNPNLIEKDQALKILQFVCFDLYQEGITSFQNSKNEEAYEIYKKLLLAENLLEKNNLKIEAKGLDKKTETLSRNDIMNNFAVFCINSGKSEEAKNILIESLKLEPTSIKYSQIIQLFTKLNDTKSRKFYIAEARIKYPRDLDILTYEINENLNDGKKMEALELLNKAIEMYPKNSQLYLVLGQNLVEDEKFIEAIQAYKKGIELFPEDFDLNYNLGRALFNQGITLYNKQDEKFHIEALKILGESKKQFEACKKMDSLKVDLDKIINEITQIK